MDRWNGKVAVVTGASSGIGAAIAEKLVAAGLKVAGVARRKDKLEELAGRLHNLRGKLYPVVADVTKEEDIANAVKWINQNVGPIHILINSAGVYKRSTLSDGRTEDWKSMLDTNVLGLCIATRETLRSMKANDIAGHIVHVNSVLGHIKPPNLSTLNVYPASKYAVTALTEILRNELISSGSKIKISSVSPGFVETDFVAVGSATSEIPIEAIQKSIASMPLLKAEDVADTVCYILGTPPHVQVHDIIIKPIGEAF